MTCKTCQTLTMKLMHFLRDNEIAEIGFNLGIGEDSSNDEYDNVKQLKRKYLLT